MAGKLISRVPDTYPLLTYVYFNVTFKLYSPDFSFIFRYLLV